MSAPATPTPYSTLRARTRPARHGQDAALIMLHPLYHLQRHVLLRLGLREAAGWVGGRDAGRGHAIACWASAPSSAAPTSHSRPLLDPRCAQQLCAPCLTAPLPLTFCSGFMGAERPPSTSAVCATKPRSTRKKWLVLNSPISPSLRMCSTVRGATWGSSWEGVGAPGVDA